MTNLHDHLEDAASAFDSLDLARMHQAAARGGRRRQRRRRGVGVVVAAAAVSALTGSALLLAPGHHGGPQLAADQVTAESFDPAHPGPVGRPDARGLAAALRWSIGQVADGTTSEYGGLEAVPVDSHPVTQGTHATLAHLTFDNVNGLGAGTVELSVQSEGRTSTTPCAVAPRYVESGASEGITVKQCTTRTLPDGSRVKAYEIDESLSGMADDSSQGTVRRRVVILDRPDGVQITTQALDGAVDSGSSIGHWQGEGDVASVDPVGTDLVWHPVPEPVLGFGDLLTIARQHFWGPTLPQQFINDGRGLQGTFVGP